MREQISYVPQDGFLFSDSVENNIRFGKSNANIDSVVRAATQASIHSDISSFPEQYHTLVGERGVTLSGGQKQRISIARALVKNPELVIFDDCLSSVDSKTEKEIISNLYDYLQNKTAIVITHRIFSLFHFDKIVVLEDGMIVETGSHEDLLSVMDITARYMRDSNSRTVKPGTDLYFRMSTSFKIGGCCKFGRFKNMAIFVILLLKIN